MTGSGSLWRRCLGLAVGVVLLGACSSGGSEGGAPGGPVTTEASEPVGSGGGTEPEVPDDDGSTGTCEGLDVEGSTPSEPAFTATSAAAVSMQGGRAYTLYLADFEVTTADLSMFSNPEVGGSNTMFMVAVTVFNAPDPEAVEPVAVGDVVEHTMAFEERTFTVIAQRGEEQMGGTTDAVGTISITAVGDRFCGTVEYQDDEKSVSGRFEAPVVAF